MDKNKRIKELEAALEPFAKGADKADKHAEDSLRLGMGALTDKATVGWGVTYGDLKKAREVFNDK